MARRSEKVAERRGSQYLYRAFGPEDPVAAGLAVASGIVSAGSIAEGCIASKGGGDCIPQAGTALFGAAVFSGTGPYAGDAFSIGTSAPYLAADTIAEVKRLRKGDW
jgi:hypothetical protein